jgi:hypothetical protein
VNSDDRVVTVKQLLEWIRTAEKVRAACQNVSEFDALIRFQKQRLKELERRSEQNMAEQTSDEFKKQCVNKMGEQLGSQYSALWQEVAVIHLNWKEYVELSVRSLSEWRCSIRLLQCFFT